MKTDFQGITYNQVKNILQEVTNQIPALDTVCSSYLINSTPTGNVILQAKIDKMNIELTVTYDVMTEIEEYIRYKVKEMFAATRKRVLYFDAAYFHYKGCDELKIIDFLNKMPNVVKMESGKYAMPFFYDGELRIPERGKQCRPYQFHVEDFLPIEEYESFE